MDRQRAALLFRTQAASDWRVYKVLVALAATPAFADHAALRASLEVQGVDIDTPIERCHCLHYLQMACEKLAKSHLFESTGTAEGELTSSHRVFAKYIGALTQSPRFHKLYLGRPDRLRRARQELKRLAEEIDRLVPSKDHPVNVEYPFPHDEPAFAPCRYEFRQLDLLHDPQGRRLLQLVGEALAGGFSPDADD